MTVDALAVIVILEVAVAVKVLSEVVVRVFVTAGAVIVSVEAL